MTLPALLTDLAADHDGQWSGPATTLHRALVERGGPGVSAVPMTAQRLTAALSTLVTDPLDGLRVTRGRRHWLIRTDAAPGPGLATLTQVLRAQDGVLLGIATCQRCGLDVMHGLGDDRQHPLLGNRVRHCCGDTYELTDPAGVLA